MERQMINCLCCGYQYDIPFDFDGEDCCPCCGINTHERDLDSVMGYQNVWLAFQTPWMDKLAKPDNWDREIWPKQMKNVPHPYNVYM